MPSAIVTGASRGIGKAIAFKLAEDGYDITINDIPTQLGNLEEVHKQILSIGRDVIIVTGDVSKEEDVQRLVDETISKFGELNVMVANAGILVPKPIMELSVEDWDQVQAVNVRGVFLCYQAAGRQMIKQGTGGKIIGACSISGFRPQPSAIAYSVSKWAVRGLTQATAIEFAPHGINVNAYCPGIVNTNMWDTIDAAAAEKHGIPKGAAFEKSVAERPAMKKPSTPEDIAATVSFLASKSSDMITGQSIIIDGGIVFA